MANYQKLQKVLTELFELDKAELDFGIYRIMNQKRADVLDFIENKLPKEVRAILESKQQQDTTALKKNLDDAIKMAKEFGLDPDTTPKVQEARAIYETAGSIMALEQEVFSHLASFFKRYYQDGDFISLRRYKKDVYAIPYEGEEVKLHWANHDQYYIKTSENLKNYAFKIDGDKTIKFSLKEANTEQNNNKTQKDQERRFALYEEEPITLEGDTLHLNFTYEPHKKTGKQDKLLKDAVAVLTTKVPKDFSEIFTLAPTEKNKKRTLLEKHLNDFSARNTFDYFIHKDLGGFLSRELDFYIKNEVLFIDDINTENEQAFSTQLSKIRALKQVAQKIIAFLAQIENFQKKLWLKKKFVISCDYCITLDRIPEKYYAEIAKNEAQHEEWKSLFNVSITNEAELKEEPFLVLDTKFFSQEFKDELMAQFDDLDENTNGVLINSENFQALNLMQEKYQEKVKTIYIDPPYNTGNDGFTYKDNFQHSSWISMVENRAILSKNLLSNDGAVFISIDDTEHKNLNQLYSSAFGEDNFITNIIWQKKYAPSNDAKWFSDNHDFISCFAKEKSIWRPNLLPRTEEANNRYTNRDNDVRGPWKSSDLSVKTYSSLTDYEITTPSGRIVKPPKGGCWRVSMAKFEELVSDNRIWFGENGENVPSIKRFLSEVKQGITPLTIWLYNEVGHNQEGKKELIAMTTEGEIFGTPKVVRLMKKIITIGANINSTILDYFAGSGTTGHATIKLNREDNGNRKYILVEMGEYFNTVTKSRIQKVIYSDSWKNGKPQDKIGISQMFKYFNLESYEDALNNLQLTPSTSQQQLLATHTDVQEEYLLQYMLDVESREQLMNVEAFKNPFNYKLKVTENNELIPTTVDLVETFNYLIGLHVKRIQRTGAFKTVEGITNRGDKVLVIWRNLEESDNEDLNRFVKKMDYNLRDGEFDAIYVNGDNNLANLKKEEETWKVLLLEEVFFTEMFDVKDV